MYYKTVGDKIVSFSSIEEIHPESETVGYLSIDEFSRYYDRLGFYSWCVDACVSSKSRYHSNLEVYDDFSYGILHMLDIHNLQQERRKIALFFRKNLFLLVNINDEDNDSDNIFSRVLEHVGPHFKLERVISGIFMRLIQGSNDILEDCETQISHMEKKLLDNEIDSQINRSIFSMKNDLTLCKDYYEELIAIAEALQNDENNLFHADESFRSLTIFINKAQRLSSNAQLLCDNLVHVREAYQSSLDYNLNNIMKIFTVVTTIFLPLTLIVGWYGMNLKMPEFSWEYSYPVIIAVCILIVVVCLLFFKRKKLL